jgi:flagellar biosynthesis/type III secretory pathway protein FliH
MTGIIKAVSAGSVVRQLGSFAAPRGGAPQELPAPSAVDLALDDAREEISRLQALLIDERKLASAAEQTAREAGRLEGRRDVETAVERQVAVVENGVALARRAWDDRLAGLDALAVMLARAALAKVFVEAVDRADLMTSAIARRVAVMRDQTVVAIRVSKSDFPDDEAVTALRSRAETGATEIHPDALLKAGECRLDLQLGQVDLSLGAQWDALDRFLGAMIADEISA